MTSDAELRVTAGRMDHPVNELAREVLADRQAARELVEALPRCVGCDAVARMRDAGGDHWCDSCEDKESMPVVEWYPQLIRMLQRIAQWGEP